MVVGNCVTGIGGWDFLKLSKVASIAYEHFHPPSKIQLKTNTFPFPNPRDPNRNNPFQ